MGLAGAGAPGRRPAPGSPRARAGAPASAQPQSLASCAQSRPAFPPPAARRPPHRTRQVAHSGADARRLRAQLVPAQSIRPALTLNFNIGFV